MDVVIVSAACVRCDEAMTFAEGLMRLFIVGHKDDRRLSPRKKLLGAAPNLVFHVVKGAVMASGKPLFIGIDIFFRNSRRSDTYIIPA